MGSEQEIANLRAELAERELARRRYSLYLPYVHGKAWIHKHIIQIKKGDDVDEQQRCETLLHEIIHVILDDREINFEDDESIAEQFARAWYQIIEDNPTMFLPKKDVKK